MWAVARCALAMIVMAAGVVSSPAGFSAAASRSSGLGIASVQPAADEVVGVAHPVIVTFTSPVVDRRAAERFIRITSQPPMTGRYVWLERDVVQWQPDSYWPAHTTIALSVGPVKATMQTGPKVIGTANISDHTFTVSIDGVETGPAELPSPHHRPFWGKPGVFPASMGRPEYPTPVGTYTVLAKERSVLMDSSSVGIPVDAPDGYRMDVEWAVRITERGLFVHSAPWAENALGYDNVSHGCISLSPTDAEWYYNTVNVGDPVIVRENSVEVPRAVTAAAG
jgi:lipoprotein-anchoring transpeptidase ErfK/SrfK